MVDVEVQRSSLQLGDKLGDGGQARGVWRVLNQHGQPSGLAYKEYKKKILDTWGPSIRHGIPALIQVRTRLDSRRQRELDERAVWPLAVVVDGSGATGVLMREFPPEYIVKLQLFTGVSPKPNELVRYLAADAEITSIGLPKMSLEQRAQLAYRTALRLQLLHSLGVVVGDFSAANILVCLTHAGHSPLMVDCDSYRVATLGAHLPQPNTPNWQAPETRALTLRINAGGTEAQLASMRAQRDVLTKPTDVYKFGLLLLRLFHTGTDHTMVRSSPSAEAQLRQLFRSRAPQLLACLAERPAARPTMNRVVALLQGK